VVAGHYHPAPVPLHPSPRLVILAAFGEGHPVGAAGDCLWTPTRPPPVVLPGQSEPGMGDGESPSPPSPPPDVFEELRVCSVRMIHLDPRKMVVSHVSHRMRPVPSDGDVGGRGQRGLDPGRASVVLQRVCGVGVKPHFTLCRGATPTFPPGSGVPRGQQLAGLNRRPIGSGHHAQCPQPVL